ncbi:MAG: hypothetical protein BWY51_00847 [Parcubacteria group bacterium ADurb.Bin316]|nr:MAG: hypothetical protein BWY51_00847 [Parcubacteria group bacterium ADurb.Bin316]
MNIEEGIFKTIFFLAIVVFIITVIGIFLLLVKILLLFTPEITIMGINMTQ